MRSYWSDGFLCCVPFWLSGDVWSRREGVLSLRSLHYWHFAATQTQAALLFRIVVAGRNILVAQAYVILLVQTEIMMMLKLLLLCTMRLVFNLVSPAQIFFHHASQTLPGEVSRFENLTTIEADNNELSSLPFALASMSIYRLSLRRNSLSSSASVDEFLAPPSIAPPGSLPLSISIRELDLSSNGLGEVPASIFACRDLQVCIYCF